MSQESRELIHGGVLARLFGGVHFPHQLSWLLDNPARKLFLSPSELVGRLPMTNRSWVLEVGPGSGFFSVEIARQIPNGRLELLDLQPEMLAKAKRKLAKERISNVGTTTQDASDPLPFKDAIFDIVVLVAVLGEIPKVHACLAELRRVLRRGGILAIHEHVFDPHRIPLASLRAAVSTHGFQLLKSWGPSWNYTASFELVES